MLTMFRISGAGFSGHGPLMTFTGLASRRGTTRESSSYRRAVRSGAPAGTRSWGAPGRGGEGGVESACAFGRQRCTTHLAISVVQAVLLQRPLQLLNAGEEGRMF